MAGDTRVILEDLDSPIGEPDVRPTADQSVRHGLKGLVDFDVIIGDLPPNFHPAAVFAARAMQCLAICRFAQGRGILGRDGLAFQMTS
jgi:hypothetical protein